MALIPIKLRPGINSVQTPTLNEGGFSAASNVRFFEGLPQKDGGFVGLVTLSTALGVPRALKAWTALSGISYLAIHGTQRLNIWNPSIGITDATPRTSLSLVPISLSTTSGSSSVVIADTVNTPSPGQWIFIRAPVSAGGLILYGAYMVTATGSHTYTVTAAVNAAGTIVNGGAVRVFTTQAGSGMISVNLPNHGLFSGQVVPVNDAQFVSGVTLQGNYVATVVDANNYTITALGQTAARSAALHENSSALNITFWSNAAAINNLAARTSSLDNWGEFILSCPERGPVFVWQPAIGGSATLVSTAPQSVGFIFVASQTQQLICCGMVNRATNLFDPMLVGFSDVGDYTAFTPTVSNQAGSFRLTIGSELRAGLALPGQNYLWTDTGMYSMQYIQPPLVYGFQPPGFNCGADGPHAVGIINEQIFWKSQDQFFTLGAGGPTPIPCPVWDQVFPNQDRANLKNVVCETNSYFGEISWSVPQTDGTVVRARMQLATATADPMSGWTADTYHHHTAWIDQNPFGAPIGATETGLIDQHEVGVDAAGTVAPTSLTTGVIMIAEGDQTTFVRQFIPDIKWLKLGVLNLTAFFYDTPNKPPRVKGPFPITPTTQTVPGIRGRARGLQFQFSGSDIGSSWRLGLMRYRAQPDGKR